MATLKSFVSLTRKGICYALFLRPLWDNLEARGILPIKFESCINIKELESVFSLDQNIMTTFGGRFSNAFVFDVYVLFYQR